MASYYKYAEKKVENEVNWGAISKGLTDSLTAEADSRVQRKAAIDKASDDDLKKMMDRPQGQYMAENSRISGFTEQAQKSQLASLRLLKSGAITEQEYNLRTNNLRTGTDMAFSLSQDYQDQYQIHMDRLKPDENGNISGSAAESMMLGQLEQFGNPAESEYYVNPLTSEVQLAITAKEGESGQVKIKDGNFNLMSLNGAKNIIYQRLNRYQSDTVTTSIAEGIGERIETLIGTNDKTGYLVTEEDAYKSLMGKDGKLSTTPEAKALKDQINASFADDNARMSFLVDTLKTYDGTAYNLVYDESEQGGANILMKKNKQGAWEADIDAEQQGLIEKGMLGLIKNKLDQTQKLKGDSRVMTDYQKDYLNVMRSRGASKEEIDEYVEYLSNQNVTYNTKGEVETSKKTIREISEDGLDLENRQETKEVIQNMFDKNSAFQNFDTRDIDVSFNDYVDEVTGQKTVSSGVAKTTASGVGAPGQPVDVYEMVTDQSVTLNVSKLMDAPITLPYSEGNILMDNYFAVLDKANQEKRKLTQKDYLDIFDGDQKLFKQYNPDINFDQAESNKKKLPGT